MLGKLYGNSKHSLSKHSTCVKLSGLVSVLLSRRDYNREDTLSFNLDCRYPTFVISNVARRIHAEIKDAQMKSKFYKKCANRKKFIMYLYGQ